jgi:hypothetical protein
MNNGVELIDSSEYHKDTKSKLLFKLNRLYKKISLIILIKIIVWLIIFK